MIELLVVVLFGAIIGCFTGLIPGLHINTVASFLIALNFENSLTAFFVVSVGVTHTFVDSVKTVFLGVPSDDTSLIVYPAHKMLLKGAGCEAVKLLTIGAFFGLLTTIILTPFLLKVFLLIKFFNKKAVAIVLISIMCYLAFKEKSFKKVIIAFVIIIFSSIIGFLTLESFNQPLFEMLSGFYGVSNLILSLNQSKIPKQFKMDIVRPEIKTIVLTIFKAIICSLLIISFPGLGPGQSASIGRVFFRKLKTSTFLIFNGSLNTIDYSMSLITLYTINRARNGSIEYVNQIININTAFYNLLITLLIAGCIAAILTFLIAKQFAKIANKLNYLKLNLFLIIFLLMMAFYFDSFNGVILLITCSIIGLIAPLTKISRTHYMSCLIVPLVINMLL